MKGHIRRRGKSTWEIKFDLGSDPSTGKRLTRSQRQRHQGARSSGGREDHRLNR